MQTRRVAAIAAAALTGVALALPGTTAQVGAAPAPAPAERSADSPRSFSDNLTPSWRLKYERRNQEAVKQRLLDGGKGVSERIKRGVHGRAAVDGRDRIFALLVEFGDTRHSAFCDETADTAPESCTFPSDGSPQRYDGPRFNEIPKPNRAVDNTTLWQKNYSRQHYENMYFKRMRNFYEQQSLGKYSFTGDVTAKVRVPFNEARYGRDYCGDIVCSSTWFLLRDGMAFWVQKKLDAGWTSARIENYLSTFDIEDRYDYDEDGDFREPDGYIDHMQVVHAGGDQADGDPTFATDAIWSHRWNAQIQPLGTGPGPAKGGFDIGEGGISDPEGSAVEIPNNPIGIWVNDYTIQPENGGLSVFAHEYAHDLGLPDLYDTSGNTGGAENSVGFWSLMSQSRGTAKRDQGIGDRPMPFGAWDKFQLGWLDYAVARAGKRSTHRLRPAQLVTKKGNNALIVILPDKQVQETLGPPCDGCGESFYYSEAGNDLDNRLTTAVDGGGELTAQVRYEIEEGWDYAFLEASSDGGETWQSLETNLSYTGQDFSGANPDGTGITGVSDGWVDLTATVPETANAIRWRYLTDGAFVLSGFQVDDISLDGALIGDGESEAGWQFDGFRLSTGNGLRGFLNAYIVDNRQYVKRDKLLAHVYNLGFTGRLADRAEFYRYRAGALISYWDTSQTDNNVGDHPGEGLILPVDAHPEFDHNPDGTLVRPRTMSFDSAFAPGRVKGFNLHYEGDRFRIEASRGVRTFDDTSRWWYNRDEHAATGHHDGRYQPGWYSVNVPETGTTVKVGKVNRKKWMTVRVGTTN
ncbi:MAG TPA: immune inhibitor A domain-containing protein [Marmoricola sp.]|nr:immune inhibitor A domain-containing protein [Marmoricola sp.]